MQHQRLGDLRADAMQRVERRHRLLEDHGDAVAAQLPHRLFAEADEFPPSNRIDPGDARAIGQSEPISASAVIVLPEPDLPDDSQALALGERKRRPIDDAAASPPGVGEIDGELGDVEQHVSFAPSVSDRARRAGRRRED